MHAYDTPEHQAEPGTGELRRAAVATGILVLACAALAFVPPSDPTKVARNLPCSVLSEQQIGDTLGTPMRLIPSNGTVCRYVSTSGERTLFVVARHDDPVTHALAHDGTPVAGVGSAAVRTGHALYVSYGSRSYMFVSTASAANDDVAFAQELRLARMVHPAIAQVR